MRLSDYLEKKDPCDPSLDRYLVDDRTIWRYITAADIVQPESTRSCCVTKNYGRFVQGTGSLLQSVTTDEGGRPIDVREIYVRQYLPALTLAEGARTTKRPFLQDDPEMLPLFAKARIRLFTPREIANLLGFPPRECDVPGRHGFDWPSEMEEKEIYRRLGNSISVDVVSMLLSYLVRPPS